MISRRRFLSMGCLAAAVPWLPGFGAATARAAFPERLVVAGPPAPLSLPLARLGRETGTTTPLPQVEMKLWRNPDIMRTWVVSGEVQVAATPANAAANLYNKGVPIRLMDVNNGGILSILTTDPAVREFTDLKGKKLLLFYRGDIPDLIVRYLAVNKGMDPDRDMDLSYVDSPFEGLQFFLSGRADTVLAPEPAATAGLMKGGKQGLKIHQIVIQQVWDQVTGRTMFLPLGGTLCQDSLVREHPELARDIQAGMGRAVDWLNGNPSKAGAEFAELFGLQAPVLRKSLERFPIKRIPADRARKDLEFFFSALMEMSPKLVGGGLPDKGFYLA